MRYLLFAFLYFAVALFTMAMSDKPDFTPVEGFELERYLGKWFEIARFPHRFEKDLTNVTATYSMRDNGKVGVLNAGLKDGEKKTARGKAKFAGAENIGHLKVSFFLFFYGDYIIVELDKDNYQWAMVVSDSYDYFWILSRTAQLEQEIIEDLLEKARVLGFDMDKLYFVPQDTD